jgi:class 3 adenylate cyclase/tetratricopeptide (TPR) repeat protein
MECSKCALKNPQDAKYCNNCGSYLGLVCSVCNKENPPGSNFCNQCGIQLRELDRDTFDRPDSQDTATPSYGNRPEGERKYITVLFSDLSNYAAMSDRMDPEEVKEIMNRIFGGITKIVAKYDGFIEKFVGDAVMALFGVTRSHEDDPIRAIRAAREIHSLVSSLSANFRAQIGHPLSMHTGITTGLVVTGEVHFEKGTHGVSGDTINLAARLSSLSNEGEILVGVETYQQARGYFDFETLEPAQIKGKSDPIQIYKVISQSKRPRKIHRFHGLKSDLIGRKAELEALLDALEKLKDGKGSIVSIYGNAGTGKSRLLEEFKSSLNLKEVFWREGQCYPYSQNITYFPLIDLLSRGLRIEEGDPPERVREKVESGLDFVEKKEDVVPYVGSLYNLTYAELEGLSPEIWRIRLQKSIQAIVDTMANRAPTIICLEDLHWADPSSLDLIRFLLSGFKYSALILCVYRPNLALFSSHQINRFRNTYQEIQLEDLSPSETQYMVESMLESDHIPIDLRQFLREKISGNPFYLEEVINSLVESGSLVDKEDRWVLKRSISESNISPTVHGVITARLDRLDKRMKRILQEASVIGRAFFYDVLNKITDLKENIENCLNGLEHLDLIKTRSLQPNLEYMFKHTLTQEVVYDGLLKKDRKAVHERIGLVMEQLFSSRLPEYYEALAYHYKRGESLHKAIDYLAKSGEKSLGRYALDESQSYYKDAFEILSNRSDKSNKDERLLIDLLNQWSFVYYYRGLFKDLLNMLNQHKSLADSLDDKNRSGMFYAWLGCALWHREKFKDAYHYLSTALKLGEETKNFKVIGYACCWLAWVCTELGMFDDAINLAERAQRICKAGSTDQYVYFNSLAGIGYALWHRGDRRKTLGVGKSLLEFGKSHCNDRIMGMGYCCIGWSHLAAGDISRATSSFQKAIKVSVDPWYSLFPKLSISYGLILDGKTKDAQQHIEKTVEFSQQFGAEFAGKPAHFFQGIVWVKNGRIDQGLKILEELLQDWIANGSKLRATACGFILATIYAHLAQNAAALNQEQLAPLAGKKAGTYFRHTIESAKEIGAKGVLGQAYLHLGLLYKAKGKTDKSGKYFSRAVQYLNRCEAEVYLSQAKENLASLAS